MYQFNYHSPASLEEAAALFRDADDPIYLAGGRMTAMMGMVPVAARTGVTHGVFSTPDTLTVSMTCGSNVMEDTSLYMDCLQESFDEYLALL